MKRPSLPNHRADFPRIDSPDRPNALSSNFRGNHLWSDNHDATNPGTGFRSRHFRRLRLCTSGA